MFNQFYRYKDVESELIVNGIYCDRNPLITIAIPTYKRPRLLKESICSALNQAGFDDYEVIVVDNDADDEFRINEIVNSYNNPKLRYFKNKKNIGMFGNWNRCIELSRGKWISILNDDDYLREDFLETWIDLSESIQADFYLFNFFMDGSFDKKGNVSACFENIVKKIINFNNSDRMLKKIDFILGNKGCGTLATLIKKSNAISIGGFNEDFYPSSDHAFWITALCKGYSIYSASNKVAWYRVEDNQSLKKETIVGWIRQFDKITWLILGKEKKIIYRIFVNAVKDYSIWRLYKKGRLLKSEFKGHNVSKISFFPIMISFYFYYMAYKAYNLLHKTSIKN